METQLTVHEPVDLALASGQPHSKNPALVYLASLAPGSRPTMAQALGAIACILTGQEPDGVSKEERERLLATIPWGSLRFQHTQAIRAKLAEIYDARTANKMLSALRRTLKEAWRLGQFYPTPEELEEAKERDLVISASDLYAHAVDIESVKGNSLPQSEQGRSLESGELDRLVAACQDGTVKGARDSAILAVAYSCGLRRAEIVNLDLSHYGQEKGILTVKGKRNKTRTVPIANGARAALDDWLTARGNEPGPLFVRIGKGHKMTMERLTTQAVYYVFAERAKQANVTKFSPHDMRRTYASDLLRKGADISIVQKLMGHSNVSTTAGYDHRGEDEKKEAAQRLHFPYQRAIKNAGKGKAREPRPQNARD